MIGARDDVSTANSRINIIIACCVKRFINLWNGAKPAFKKTSFYKMLM